MSPCSLLGPGSILCPPAASELGQPLSRELWVQGQGWCSGGWTRSRPVRVPAGVPCPVMAKCSVVVHCAGRGGPRLDLAPSLRFVFVGSSCEREPGLSEPPGCTSAGESWIIRLLIASQLIYLKSPKDRQGPD